MIFFIDVDNKERFKIKSNAVTDIDIKNIAKSIKREDEDRVHLDIKNIGVMIVDNIIVDYKQKAAIFKCSLLMDYRESYVDNELEEDLWNSFNTMESVVVV